MVKNELDVEDYPEIDIQLHPGMGEKYGLDDSFRARLVGIGTATVDGKLETQRSIYVGKRWAFVKEQDILSMD